MTRSILYLATALSLVVSSTSGQSLQSAKAESGKLKGEARKTWHLSDFKSVKAYGTAVDKTLNELIGTRIPEKKITVAVIDSGVDDEHEDLVGQLWVNPDEVAGNQIDDDGNGLVDDIHGWNFLVDEEGNSFIHANLEATRVLRLSKDLQTKREPYPAWLTEEMLQRAADIFNENTNELNGLYKFAAMYARIDSVVVSVLGDTAYTMDEVKAIESDNQDVKDAQTIYGILTKLGVSKGDLKEMQAMVDKFQHYYLNLDYQPRKEIIFDWEHYGNHDIGGKHTEHGTHVAGIIAANARNQIGMRGIAGDYADIMVLKVVPDGDESDIDVANAIRYAVDEGAHIINMSFGKGISPAKERVWEAMEYAAEHGVLMVHAAGNDADNSDHVGNYPNDEGLSDSAKLHYLCIGALSPEKGKRMLAAFSNYGGESVHLFAPGEDIYATLPGNAYGYRSGTSMAAPVVSGVAALVWAFHPELSASELRNLLIESGTDLGKKKVFIPGSKEKARFRELSTSARVINAYDAFQRADQQKL